MSNEPVSREECQEEKKNVNNAIIRIHERVDKVENTTSEIKVSAKNIESCVCRMEKIMYGDQNSNGVLTKVSNLGQKVNGVFWLGSVVIMATITCLVALIFKR